MKLEFFKKGNFFISFFFLILQNTKNNFKTYKRPKLVQDSSLCHITLP